MNVFDPSLEKGDTESYCICNIVFLTSLKMNKNVKFFMILLAVVVIFLATGCLEKSERGVLEDKEVTADTLLDNRLYTEAAEGADIQKCSLISNETKAAECKKVVNANMITQQALQKKSKVTCNKINLARYRETCKQKVEDLLKLEREKAEQAEKLAEMSELAQEINDSGDVTRCKELENENFEKTCELNILVNKAIQAKSKDSCGEASTKELQKQCADDFAQATDAL